MEIIMVTIILIPILSNYQRLKEKMETIEEKLDLILGRNEIEWMDGEKRSRFKSMICDLYSEGHVSDARKLEERISLDRR